MPPHSHAEPLSPLRTFELHCYKTSSRSHLHPGWEFLCHLSCFDASAWIMQATSGSLKLAEGPRVFIFDRISTSDWCGPHERDISLGSIRLYVITKEIGQFRLYLASQENLLFHDQISWKGVSSISIFIGFERIYICSCFVLVFILLSVIMDSLIFTYLVYFRQLSFHEVLMSTLSFGQVVTIASSWWLYPLDILFLVFAVAEAKCPGSRPSLPQTWDLPDGQGSLDPVSRRYHFHAKRLTLNTGDWKEENEAFVSISSTNCIGG